MRAEPVYLGDVWRPERFKPEELTANPLVRLRSGGTPAVYWPWYEWPDVILVAQPGAGKTRLLAVAANEICKVPGPKVPILCDGKGVGSFYLLEHVKGVRVHNDRDAIAAAVRDTADLVDKRRQFLATARRQSARSRTRFDGWQPLVPVFLWIDDYIGWLLLLDKDVREEVVSLLGLICFQGRELGVRVLLSMQTPHAQAFDAGLSPQIKMSCVVRIGLPGEMGFDDTQARMLWGDASAKDRIPNVTGGGLVKVGGAEAAFLPAHWQDPTDPEEQQHLTDGQIAELWAQVAA
jgi:hypothetical protein